MATKDEIKLVHPPGYISYITQLSSMSQDELLAEQKKVNSVYYHADTFESASVAAGCALEVTFQIALYENKTKLMKY